MATEFVLTRARQLPRESFTGSRVYVTNRGSHGETCGLVGSILVMLIWLYLSALTILFGGEVAVSIEHGIHRKDGVAGPLA